MNKSIIVYAALLAVGLGASWNRYTSDETTPKEGVVLLEAKAADLQKIGYDGADLDVNFEMRADDFGRYGWVTAVENKKKKVDGVEQIEVKTTRFKTGSAADKLTEAFAPLLALRALDNVDDAKLESFGLKAPETLVTVTTTGGTLTLELGGETYGTKDRYVRVRETSRVYVVKDEAFKSMKFAVTRLPERSLTAAKAEEIEGLTLGRGADNVEWSQKNKDDRTAAYWQRTGAPDGKDESFANWMEKMLKVKSTGYTQDDETPTDLVPSFDLTVRVAGKPAETVRFMTSGDDWYAQSESTRGVVKLSRGAAKDVADDVDDILEGREPPKKEKPAPGDPQAKDGPPGRPPGMPPGMPQRPRMPVPPPHK